MVASNNVMASMLVYQDLLIFCILILHVNFLKREKEQNSQGLIADRKSSFPVIKNQQDFIQTSFSISLRKNGWIRLKHIITMIFHLFQLLTVLESNGHLFNNAKKLFGSVFMRLHPKQYIGGCSVTLCREFPRRYG